MSSADRTSRPRRTGSLLVALPLLLACLGAEAAAYRWTDAQGRVQYSDRPPADAPAERVGVPGAPASATSEVEVKPQAEGEAAASPPGASGEPGAAPAAAGEDQAAREQAQREAQQKYQEELRKYCATERENLRKLEGDAEIIVKGADGRSRKLDQAGKQQKIGQTRANLRQHCQ